MCLEKQKKEILLLLRFYEKSLVKWYKMKTKTDNEKVFQKIYIDKIKDEIEIIKGKIKRNDFSRAIKSGRVKIPEGSITDDDIQRVKQIKISDLHKFNSAGFATSIYNITEKTPSMKYWEKNNRYKCFSSDKGGDVINFIMDRDGLTFIETIKQLRKTIC